MHATWQQTSVDYCLRRRSYRLRICEFRETVCRQSNAIRVMPIATCPVPDPKEFAKSGRFGAHNIHENVPLPTAWQSETIVLGTFFNGGLRAYDISNAYQPREAGVFIPPAPARAPTGTIQLNDVFVDERRIVYTVDRHIGGLYILEMNF